MSEDVNLTEKIVTEKIQDMQKAVSVGVTAELLRELIRMQKKEAKHARLTSIFTAIILIVFIAIAAVIVPKAVVTLNEATTTIIQAQKSLANVDEQLEGISAMTKSITRTSENLNNMVESNTQAITDAVGSIGKVDFDGLNQAISDLQSTTSKFASFFGTN